jgi:hypothetical protein
MPGRYHHAAIARLAATRLTWASHARAARLPLQASPRSLLLFQY